MKIGYAPVNTKSQGESLKTQRDALTAAGYAKVFEEVAVGAKSEHPT